MTSHAFCRSAKAVKVRKLSIAQGNVDYFIFTVRLLEKLLYHFMITRE